MGATAGAGMEGLLEVGRDNEGKGGSGN